jgi:hypothetical protein
MDRPVECFFRQHRNGGSAAAIVFFPLRPYRHIGKNPSLPVIATLDINPRPFPDRF